jgi:post-segregation antitoxin (ccd killing protein)
MGKVELKIEVDEATLEFLRSAGFDVEGMTLEMLASAVRRLQDDQRGQAAADAWAAENKMALQIMRERIEQHGVIGEDFRTW